MKKAKRIDFVNLLCIYRKSKTSPIGDAFLLCSSVLDYAYRLFAATAEGYDHRNNAAAVATVALIRAAAVSTATATAHQKDDEPQAVASAAVVVRTIIGIALVACATAIVKVRHYNFLHSF